MGEAEEGKKGSFQELAKGSDWRAWFCGGDDPYYNIENIAPKNIKVPRTPSFIPSRTAVSPRSKENPKSSM